jgi:hypothetical protein
MSRLKKEAKKISWVKIARIFIKLKRLNTFWHVQPEKNNFYTSTGI